MEVGIAGAPGPSPIPESQMEKGDRHWQQNNANAHWFSAAGGLKEAEHTPQASIPNAP